jgi:hypothetical protein
MNSRMEWEAHRYTPGFSVQSLIVRLQFFFAVLRIRIRICRIHVFLGLLDPDPLVSGLDPDPDPNMDLSNSKQK